MGELVVEWVYLQVQQKHYGAVSPIHAYFQLQAAVGTLALLHQVEPDAHDVRLQVRGERLLECTLVAKKLWKLLSELTHFVDVDHSLTVGGPRAYHKDSLIFYL